jgi:3-oxoacyl-[acyl-carrier protein] reductase
MDLGMQGKTVLVTGASRGIGKAVALGYAAEGANVAVTYRSDEQRAADVVREVEARGGKGLAVPLELADTASVTAAVGTVAQHWGGLDVLVANAVQWGSMGDFGKTLADSDPASWTHVLRANLEGTAATVRAAMPYLVEAAAGRIVLVSSGVSRHGLKGSTAYGAAKAALDGFMAGLKWEAGEHGVLVNVVSPGFTVTERNLERFPDSMREEVSARTPTRRLSGPADVAAAVLFLGSPANGNVTGSYLAVAGGID